MAAGRAWMAAAPILFILMGATEAVGNTELDQLLAEVEEFAKTGPGGENNAVEVITFTSDAWNALSEFLSKLAEVADANNEYLDYLQKASSVTLQCIDKIETSIEQKCPSLEYTEATHAAVQNLDVTKADPSTIAEAASALSEWIEAAKEAIKSFPADDEWAKAMGCILLFKKVYQKSLDFTGSLSQVQKNPEAVAGRRISGAPPPIPIAVPSTENGNTESNGFDWSSILDFCETSFGYLGILYSLVAPATSSITLSTCNSADYDTKISVYKGDDPATASCVRGRDDTPGCSIATTEVSFYAGDGQSYLVLVHGFFAAAGAFSLSTTYVPAPPPIAIQVPSTSAGDTESNGFDWSILLGSCVTSITTDGILYSLVAPFTGGITLSTCNSASYDTKIRVYQGADPATASCVTERDDTPGCSGLTTELSFLAVNGQSYLVLVHGVGSQTGTFSLRAVPGPIPIPVPSTVAGDTAAANGLDWSSLGECGTPITGPGILYSLVAPDTGSITVFTCNLASYNTMISVYAGAVLGAASCVTGLDDTAGCSGGTTKLSFDAINGQSFLVLVHGVGSETGFFSLSTTFVPDPIPIPVPSTRDGNTLANGVDWSSLGECGTSITGPGILYSLVAPDTGSITVSTCDSASYNTKISVYQGADPDTASCVTGLDDTTGCSDFTTKLSFYAEKDQSFLVLVHGAGSETGVFSLSTAFEATPDPVPIAVPSTVAGDTAANGFPWSSLGECGTSITAPGILYSLEAPGTGSITVSTCNSASYNTKISVYQGADPATASCVTGLDDTTGCSDFTTKLSFYAENGQSFLVLVHGVGSETGTFTLRVKFVVWCQEVGGLEYSLLDKGKKNVVKSCLKRTKLREVISRAAVNQRLSIPSGGSLVLSLGLVALFGFTALAALLVKRRIYLSRPEGIPLQSAEE